MKNNLLPKKINWKVNGRIFGFGSSPEADWKIILITGIILSLLGIALNAYIYVKINQREIFQSDDVVEERSTLNISELQTTTEYYKNKSNTFQNILRSATSTAVSDPSI